MQLPNLSGMNYLAITAILASVTAGWNQVKTYFFKFKMLFFESIEIHGADNEGIIFSYMNKNFKVGKLRSKSLCGTSAYVKPEKGIIQVGYELPNSTQVYYKGWKPIFLKSSGIRNNNEPVKKYGSDTVVNNLTLTTFRFFFDLEKLFIEALKDHNNKKKSNQIDRFAIRKMFGYGKSRENNKQDEMTEGQAKSLGDNDVIKRHRLLIWKEEDLDYPKPNKPFTGLSYGPKVIAFKEEVRRWLDAKEFFEKKNLPHQLGASLTGLAGSGKTRFARALAQEMNMPMFIFDLTSMTNREFTESWRKAVENSPAIVLLEDLDRMFIDRIFQSKEGLTLDVVLNCICGVEKSDGILTLVSANDITKLDTALGIPMEGEKSTRPGRLDRHLYFGNLSQEDKIKIADDFFDGIPDEFKQKVFEVNEDETGAQFVDRCKTIALDYIKKNVVGLNS